MTENQKLREALQAISHIDDATSHTADASAALDRIGQIARQALALPTADHMPDAGKMVNGLTKAETDASASVSGLTAAPVCEREAFEREMSKPPFEFCMDRWPDDGSSYVWPGNYAAYHTQCAWDAWRARASLSAGDAVDAQRYRWLADCNNYYEAIALISDGALTADALGKAIDAAMRKDKP